MLTLEEKKARMKASRKKYYEKIRDEKRLAKLEKRVIVPKDPRLSMWRSAKARAASKGIEFSIEPADITIPDTCPVFGIPLQHYVGRAWPNSPSLDRRDSSKGYTRENICVISWRANKLKSDANSAELAALLAYSLK